MKAVYKILGGVLCVLFFSAISTADITFTNDKWESTFDCDAWSQSDGETEEDVACDGWETGISHYCEGSGESEIATAANYSSGGGGRGFRLLYGDRDGATGSATNSYSTNFSIVFPSPYPTEIWIRWYMRVENGMDLGRMLYWKLLYLYDNSSNSRYLDNCYDGGCFRFSDGSTITNYGWDDIYGSSSDGTWHCYEVHMNITAQTARFWVDGIDRGNVSSVTYAITNFEHILFSSNAKAETSYTNNACYAVDYDDVVIYKTTPPNQDASGDYMIGPIGWGTPSLPNFKIGSGFRANGNRWVFE